MRSMAALLLCLASLSALADERGLRTENRDGTWWQTVPGADKDLYITGLRDGALLGVYYTVPKMEEKNAAECRSAMLENFDDRRRFLDDLTVTELVKRLDQFYGDKKNATVVVPAALFYLSRRAAGDNDERLQKLLGGFRRPLTE